MYLNDVDNLLSESWPEICVRNRYAKCFSFFGWLKFISINVMLTLCMHDIWKRVVFSTQNSGQVELKDCRIMWKLDPHRIFKKLTLNLKEFSVSPLS